MLFQVLFVILYTIGSLSDLKDEHLIISLISDDSSINNLELTIKSILNQNIERSQYEIVLFRSKNYSLLSNNFTYFLSLNKIILKIATPK